MTDHGYDHFADFTVNELWENLEEMAARLESYCRETPINVDLARIAALNIKAIETELVDRGAL